MAAKTSLIALMVDPDDNLLKKSIPYANPEASNADLAAFSKKAVGLTTNTYVDTQRVDVISLNEATADDETSDDEGGGE